MLPLIAALVFVPALLALGFLVGAVPFYVRRSRRNEQARALVKSIAAGTKRKHVLVYLRQFEPHRGWTFGLVRTPADGSSVFDADAARFNLESWVDSLGTAQVEVLKVSDRIDAAGGSIRLKDDEWKVHVLALIRAADSIVLLPGLSEGVLWEARQVREQGKLAATTVVMPFGITARAEHDLWNSYRTDYAKLGYTLPPFDADGMLMKFSDDGSVSSAVPLIGTSYSELTEFVVSPAPAAERRT